MRKFTVRPKRRILAASDASYAYDITGIANNYEVDVVTWESIQDDYSYHKLIKTVNEAERFNYHSDYWGDAESYQNDNIDLVEAVEPYIGEKVKYEYDDGVLVGTLKGVLIDRQYNALSHTKLYIDPVDEDSTN